jgi:hypothetical protein
MKKYVYAIIKIPLEITDEDSYQPLTDYSAISFEECGELPEKTASATKTKFRDFLKNVAGSSEKEIIAKDTEECYDDEPAIEKEPEVNEVKLVVLKSDIKKRDSKRLNSSFKQRSRTNLRRTARLDL